MNNDLIGAAPTGHTGSAFNRGAERRKRVQRAVTRPATHPVASAHLASKAQHFTLTARFLAAMAPKFTKHLVPDAKYIAFVDHMLGLR